MTCKNSDKHALKMSFCVKLCLLARYSESTKMIWKFRKIEILAKSSPLLKKRPPFFKRPLTYH